MTEQSRSALLLLFAGFSLWALAFVMLYALQALGCAYGWPQHRLILVGAYLLALLAMAWLAWTTPIGHRATGLWQLPRNGPTGPPSPRRYWCCCRPASSPPVSEAHGRHCRTRQLSMPIAQK
ncbi:hypothetical protein N8D56_01650 [Devosia sp. A8/3-2]|nr:hypothetical protein N8D56_01650 [Devosia sp. A8/3-2]